MTLSAATLAGETSDKRELERERRRIMRQVMHWVEHNRKCVLEQRPDLADMCAVDCIDTLAETGQPVPPAIAGALEAWAYAERLYSSFVIRTATTTIPGVRLGYMYKDVHDTPWPAAA